MHMPHQGPDNAQRMWRLGALTAILASALFHIVYLFAYCPLNLAPDEAHYWDWSRRLDWSYYSKGPLVAYLIRAGCLVLGDTMPGVRLPAVVCGSLLLLSLYVLTRQVYRQERLACAVVLVALTLPLVAAGSTLMTIDSPYTCCWGWALVLTHHAIFQRSRWAWLAAGLIVGLGILAKYTMVLFFPALGLYLLTSRVHRPLLGRPGFWLMGLMAALCCTPIIIWNIQHDWITLRHVGRQAGAETGGALFWTGPLIYLGTQAALLLGFWFVAWLGALWRFAPWRQAEEGEHYLWWMSALMFGVFLGFSLKTRGGEPNWPITTYLSGLVLTAGWLQRRLQETVGLTRKATVFGIVTTCLVGLGLTLLIHRSDLAYPLLAPLAGPVTDARPLPLRRLDPTCRLRGWSTLGAEVDEVVAQLRSEGVEPVLAGTGWALPGAIGFHVREQPTVTSLGPALGDRKSQYDLWRPNPIDDPELFRGRTFVIVGGYSPGFATGFDTVERPREVLHREAGQPLASWMVTVARGYRGFPRPDGVRTTY